MVKREKKEYTHKRDSLRCLLCPDLVTMDDEKLSLQFLVLEIDVTDGTV